MAFADRFDAAYSLKPDLQTILKRSVDILMSTDSLSVFFVITKSSTTAMKRLMINLAVVREAYDRMEIAQLAFPRTNWNSADALTKVSRNTYLETTLTTEQLIISWRNGSLAGAYSDKRKVASIGIPHC
jgi:hypothetical protein